jgi:hypothetical protein
LSELAVPRWVLDRPATLTNLWPSLHKLYLEQLVSWAFGFPCTGIKLRSKASTQECRMSNDGAYRKEVKY